MLSNTDGAAPAPVFTDVEAAARRIAGHAQRTPLLSWLELDRRLGTHAFVKPECLQLTGSFKFRGAYNKIKSALESHEEVPGVVAFSSGNHAQGVAAAAGQLGVPAIIVMPEDAPRIKIENTRALGAEVKLYDRYKEDREAIARAIARDKGYLVVPPYDDPAIIAGQGTIGLEIAEDCAKLGVTPDVVLAPCSGGGLISGIATAIKARSPEARVFACEPARFDDTARSLAAGRRLENEGSEKSICDALLSKSPGEITFPINKRLLSGGLVATDEEALAAVAFAARRLKLVVEPGGAVALAAALQGRAPKDARTIVIVCSGGNIDDEMLRKALAN
ncbi:threonine ammonia-lyase [Dongia deserti]|uniref:threonine ammonia-lyase n=1 Tax=Dongia deserti TaxID=2268030 RepID=UPI002546A9B8|nr:threonine/serine dehydratase [Dongia deserti]